MKNLKKTLSLVLVAVMMLGILTIGAGAAFTDQADVDYTEAVDVLSAIKVLEGFEDGSFKPDQILTREQAAKIIAYAMLGKTAADALTTGTAPFTDVPASRWSAGYITFCVNQGIINGYGDGTFGPADTLTGFQFAKMLLCALGYGKNDEFVGSNWTIEVAKLAIPLGIFEGNTEGASNAPCTREAAALYAFNAMTKCMTVNYAEALGIYYSGTNALQAPEDEDEYKHTLGYKVFGLESEDKVFAGRSGHYWTVNGVLITDFYSSDTIIGTHTTGTNAFSPFANLTTKGALGFIAEADKDGYTVYYNGVELTGTPNPSIGGMYFDAITNEIKIKPSEEAAAAVYNLPVGSTIELIDTNDEGNKVDIISIVEKEFITIKADPIESFGTIKINGEQFSADEIRGYEDLRRDDYALKVKIEDVTYFEKCESFTGVLESKGTFFGMPYYVINGTQYSLSGLNAELTDLTNFGVELVYYLDSNGYIVASSEDETVSTSYYGLVLASDGGAFNPIRGTGAYAQVYLLTQTGEADIFDVVASGKPAVGLTEDNALQGKLIKYNLTASGKITNVVTADEGGKTISNFTFDQGQTKIGTENDYVSSATYFFYYNGSDSYSVVKGYTNATPVTAGEDPIKAYYFATGKNVKAVLIEAEAVGTADVIFISSGDYTTGMLSDNTIYYNFTCYRDGKMETIKLADRNYYAPWGASPIGVGAYTVVKDFDSDLYTASRFVTPDEVFNFETFDYDPTPVKYADETYFVVDVGAESVTYAITPTTEVYLVTYGVHNAVIDVEPVKMVGPTSRDDVKIVAVLATGSGTEYTASAVFYRIDPK